MAIRPLGNGLEPLNKGQETCVVPADGRIQVKSGGSTDEVFIYNLLPCYDYAKIRRIYDIPLRQVP